MWTSVGADLGASYCRTLRTVHCGTVWVRAWVRAGSHRSPQLHTLVLDLHRIAFSATASASTGRLKMGPPCVRANLAPRTGRQRFDSARGSQAPTAPCLTTGRLRSF